jgi:predicted AAA+ superfamily ATPase
VLPDQLTQIILDQKESFNRPRRLVERDIHLKPFLSTSQVVVITGVRRCGKSSLLQLIKQKLKLGESDYCYFNFDDERIIRETTLLDQIYQSHLVMYNTEPTFFFDEIQNVPDWEKFVNRMYERGIKLFVTGSNANLLSSEIASSLTGRNKTITLYPFSFREYLKLKEKKYDLSALTTHKTSLLIRDFTDYMHYGGFPLVIQESDLEIINHYFQDILYRDIISRYRISQVNEIKQIALFLSSNTGKLFSYATLQQVSGVKSTHSIKSYLEYFEQSYLFCYLRKFDYSVKKQIMNSKKAFAIDPAIANRLGFQFTENKGRILENIVYLQLIRSGKEVFYHSAKKECDFIVRDGLKITQAIQVAYELTEINLKRETQGLLEAMETYGIKKGLLLTHQMIPRLSATPENITIMPVWKWLLGDHL